MLKKIEGKDIHHTSKQPAESSWCQAAMNSVFSEQYPATGMVIYFTILFISDTFWAFSRKSVQAISKFYLFEINFYCLEI